MKIEFRCDEEHKIVGILETTKVPGFSGKTMVLTWGALVSGFRPASEAYTLTDRVDDGKAMLCPRCKHPLVFDGRTSKGVDMIGVTVVVGKTEVQR